MSKRLSANELSEAFEEFSDTLGNWDYARASIDGHIAALEAEISAARRFKNYVHARLDAAGIPTHPDGPHSAEGCRIGDRLDIALRQRMPSQDDLVRAVKIEVRAAEIYATIPGSEHHPWVPGGNSLMQDEARRRAVAEIPFGTATADAQEGR